MCFKGSVLSIMRFVLSGIETQNKGAELMLYAILQEIERRFPKASVFLPLDSVPQGLSYIRTTLTLREKPIRSIRKWGEALHINGFLRRIRCPKIVYEDIYSVPKTDFFLDASGLYYSDVWNLSESFVEKRNTLLQKHHKQGSRIVFLPQSFGPLTQKSIKSGIIGLDKYVDLVCARDRVSLSYLRDSGLIDLSKVRLYPDFTASVKGVIPNRLDHLYNGVCIIPNCHLFNKRGLCLHDYVSLVELICRLSFSIGRTPYFLNHEGADDRKIIHEINNAMGRRLEIVDELNALEVKGMISTAYLTISSRFHGVASSLNSCVPCLSIGWSHKYEELFRDYGQSDGLLPIEDLKECETIICRFLNEEQNRSIRLMLENRVIENLESTQAMWDEVWN